MFDFNSSVRIHRATSSLLLALTITSPAAVLINEFLAANSQANRDQAGDNDDWIELHNAGTNSVDVGGWFLTDDLTQTDGWQIPTNLATQTTIPPGGHLLVWADNEPSEGPFHATFKLDADGEEIALLAPDGSTLIDQVAFDAQDTDFSFGRYPDGGPGWLVLRKPTPGTSNAVGFLGDVAPPRFSVQRGVYELTAGFTVTLNCRTPDAEIYFTTNGTAPSPTNGTRYAGPIPIASTTVLRAASHKTAWRPSKVETHTYLVNLDTARRSLPAVALAADPNTTFGLDGLFADVLARGPAGEFPVSIEYLPPANNGAHQQDAGLRLQGSSYRRRTIGPNPAAKWSFKLYFRNDYGDRNMLEQPLIPESALNRFPTLVLRSGYNDPSNPFIKDELGRRLFADMGQPSALGTFANLFINGQLKNNGYYNPTERIDDDTLREKFGSDHPWDVVTKWQPSGTAADPPRSHPAPYLFDVRDGDHVAFAALLDYALTHHLADPAHYSEIRQRLDLVNFVDYLILQGYSRIRDWPQNNWNAARERSTGDLGRWKFYAWDLEFGWGPNELTDTFKAPPTSSDNPLGILYHRLGASPQFRQLFTDRVQHHFFNHGALTPARVALRFESMRQILAAVIPNMDAYIRDVFARDRPGYVLNSLTAQGLFTHEGPRFRIDGQPQHSGDITAGATLTLDRPTGTGTLFFSLAGSDPTNNIFPGTLTLDTTTFVRSRLRLGSVWSGVVEALFRTHPVTAATNLVITELHYHPLTPSPAEVAANPELSAGDFEFLELANLSNDPLDLPGIRFSAGIDFAFPEDGLLTLQPGQRIVLAKNPSALTLRYGPITHLAGPYRGQLANGGERLEYVTAAENTIASIRFADDWHPSTDGHGFSLVLANQTNPSPTASTASSWRPSHQPGGSPGVPDPPPQTFAPVVITETLTHTDPPQLDAIELHNPGPTPADIAGWFLTDDFTLPRKFRIPDGTTLPPGAFLVFTEADFNPQPGSSTSFSLSSRGEEVYLFSADPAGTLTGYAQGHAFGAAATGVSFGRHLTADGTEHFVSQTVPSLGASNTAPLVGPVVISELMYHPRDRSIGATPVDNLLDEFVELENISDSTVRLADPAASTNTWRLRGAIEFDFAPNRSIPPGGRLLVVPFNPKTDLQLRDAFRSRYALPDTAALAGPFDGKLNNSGERLDLLRPDPPDPPGAETPFILVDRVHYADRSPWPTAADGTGLSLQRILPTAFGNNPANWAAATATPAAAFDGGQHPAILQQPATQTVWPGSNALFTVDAISQTSIRYQWRFDGADIPNATNASLLQQDVQPTHEGVYTVRLTDQLGAVTSNPAHLYVMVAPVIIQSPPDLTVVQGGSVTFGLRITGSPPPFMYLLRHGSHPLASVIRQEHSCFFTLTNLTPDATGLYRLIVTNAALPLLRVNATFNLTLLADTDHDGLPDEWELAHDLDPASPEDASRDDDGDSHSNAEEYRAGTNPADPDSYLRVENLETTDSTRITFNAVASRTYTLQALDSLSAPAWIRLADIHARPTNFTAIILDPAPPPLRFYRLTTPRLPNPE